MESLPVLEIGEDLSFGTGPVTVLAFAYIPKKQEGEVDRALVFGWRGGETYNPFVTFYITPQTWAFQEWYEGYYADKAAPAVVEFKRRLDKVS